MSFTVHGLAVSQGIAIGHAHAIAELRHATGLYLALQAFLR